MEIKCPECGKKMTVKNESLGRWGTCKHCHEKIQALPQNNISAQQVDFDAEIEEKVESEVERRLNEDKVKKFKANTRNVNEFSKGMKVAVICVALLFFFYGIKECSGCFNTSSNTSVSNSSKIPIPQIPSHRIITVEDASYNNVVRKIYRVRVPRKMNKQELTSISNKIVQQATSRKKIKAIGILFYLPNTDTNLSYTAGTADWAPGGNWENAASDLTPKLVVKAGSSLGNFTIKNKVDMPDSKKRKIYFQIVKYQDQGMGVKQSREQVARKFKITVDQVKSICIEGGLSSWPMP